MSKFKPEPQAPLGLQALQASFGLAMATPFEISDDGFSLNTVHYPGDILAQMVPCPIRDLDGATRLSTYNRQYWFRLLTIMQKEYPLTSRMMGLTEFNKMVMAFFTACPPAHYSLRHLSDGLGQWLEGESDWGLEIIKQSIALEHAFIESFDAAEAPPLDLSSMSSKELEQLSAQRLYFQPHVFLFSEDWVLMHHKRALKGLDTDSEYAFEVEKADGYWLIYRQNGQVEAESLGLLQYLVLMKLWQGQSLEMALEMVAEGLPQTHLEHMVQNIQAWFARWTALGIWSRPEQTPEA